MKITIEQFEELLNLEEHEKLEFKTAKDSYSADELVKYCCALANEKGGHIILGVSDDREVVGTNAFQNLGKIKQKVMSSLALRVEIVELKYNGKRVLVFEMPPRPIGVPKKYQDIYWMRRGGSLVSMTEDMLKRIFDEAVPDFSARICQDSTINDLSTDAIENYRRRVIRRSGEKKYAHQTLKQFLNDTELMDDNKVTYSALVLFGTSKSLGKFLAQSEVIFEYKSKEKAGPPNQRIEFREGFFLFYDKLWEIINLRNDTQHFQDGLFIQDIPTFSEGTIREAILNAISHRDYQNPGSVFIRQFPEYIIVTSPGGFPSGITKENILYRQSPRNRRIAEAFARCGLVERSGQGVDRMYEEAIKQSKSLPDFSGTDAFEVSLTFNGRVRDVNFIKFLEKASKEHSMSFSIYDLLTLDTILKGSKIPERRKLYAQRLCDEGVIERISHGKYILSRKYYTLAGKKGIYTRKKGLDRNTNKQLLLTHIRENAEIGSRLGELMQVLPALTRSQVKYLIKSLNLEGQVYKEGNKRNALWFPLKKE